MTDNEIKKQPLPEEPRNPAEGGSTQPSAPMEGTTPPGVGYAGIQQAPAPAPTQSPARPPPPAAGFIYPNTEIHTNGGGAPPQPPPTTVPPYPTSSTDAAQNVSYDVPPPSYQAAMSYPAAPTYNGSTDPKFYSGQPPYYQPPPVITQTRLPQPEPQSISQIIRTVRVDNPNGNVVVHVQPGASCRRCTLGVITRQTDMCCLLCLIMLTIFTFPFGLIFLCCVPCTVQNRCTNCGRIA